MYGFKVLLLIILYCSATSRSGASASAIPIWERLTQQEKIGHLMYLYLHLVDVYCKESLIPDCAKVLTLYGTSNLMNQNEHVLNTLDPYQRDARDLIWNRITNGAFNFPTQELEHNHIDREEEFNNLPNLRNFDLNLPDYSDVAVSDPHPHAVRVAPPANFKVPEENTSSSSRNTVTEDLQTSPSFNQNSIQVAQKQQDSSFYTVLPYQNSNSFRDQLSHLEEPSMSLNFNGLNHQFARRTQPSSGRNPVGNFVDPMSFQRASPFRRNQPILLRILKR